MSDSPYYPTRDAEADALRRKLDALRVAASTMLDHLDAIPLDGCVKSCRDDLRAALTEADK